MNQLNLHLNMISSAAANQPQAGRRLSDAQKTQVTEILKAYDVNNLSTDDVLAIREAFKSAKIAPGRDLRSAVEGAGFQMTQLALPERASGAGESTASASASDAGKCGPGTMIDVRV
ncbi:MAG: hypothetical protein HY253_07440 [Burkholderiales bacterium]|nr:hypothetical protein [Burkholderiales bacterium]